MVLVFLKSLMTGGTQKPLLPTDSTNTEYSSLDDGSLKSSLSYEGISNPRIVSDIIIGLSDGLTVPFALTAGLSSLGNSKLVITGGMAELVSGAISMGLGGFLAAKSEKEFFHSQLAKENADYENPSDAQVRIAEALSEFKLSGDTLAAIANDIEKDQDIYSNFMVKVVRGIEEPAEGRELTSALTIGLSYFFGGFIPLIPYFFADVVQTGLIYSALIMVVTLFIFGYFKTVLSLGTDTPTRNCMWNGLSMLLTGGFAASAAWGLVRAIE
nr:Ccc1 [Starmerella bombicola]